MGSLEWAEVEGLEELSGFEGMICLVMQEVEVAFQLRV